jgi:hypothetical protein
VNVAGNIVAAFDTAGVASKNQAAKPFDPPSTRS